MPIALTFFACAPTYAEMSGISLMHGEHQVAQKLTMTQRPCCADSSKILPSSVLIESAGFALVACGSSACAAPVATKAAKANARARTEDVMRAPSVAGEERRS